jgi:hypothetical protein
VSLGLAKATKIDLRSYVELNGSGTKMNAFGKRLFEWLLARRATKVVAEHSVRIRARRTNGGAVNLSLREPFRDEVRIDDPC